MIIILEGPDGGGKTYLAEEITARLDFNYHHEGAEPDLNSQQLLERYLSLPADNTVFDRFAISEQVYAKAMNRPARLTREECGQCFVAMRAVAQVVNVLCLPPLETCLESLQSRGDTLVDDTILRKVWSDYSFLGATQPWDLIYDRTSQLAVHHFLVSIERMRNA